MTAFQDTWGFPSEVLKTIPHAKAWTVENTDRTFRTGRAVVDVIFYNGDRREISRRQGMRLVSKAGKDYEVCRREPDAPRKTPAVAMPCGPAVEDVFE